MKITVLLSFLLCLPAMTMADERSLRDQVVSAEAGQRQLAKSTKSKSGKSYRRRLAKSSKGGKASRRLSSAKSNKTGKASGRRLSNGSKSS